jgi:hypothetical protein
MIAYGTFLQRPADGCRNLDDLFAAEYVLELMEAAIIGSTSVDIARDITEVEAITLFCLGFTLEQANHGLALLRMAIGHDDGHEFADESVEKWRRKVRSFSHPDGVMWSIANL